MKTTLEFNFPQHALASVVANDVRGTQFFMRDDARIAYDYEPPSSGHSPSQLLVLINGFARPRADFRAFRKRIQTQMPSLATLALDNRGAGETEGGLAHLTVQTMALDAAFISQVYASYLSLPAYHTLGISMGGMIAQTWAAQDARIASLTLVSTTAGGGARVWPSGVRGEEARLKPFEPWPSETDAMLRRMSRYFGAQFRKNSPLLIEMMVKNMLKSQGERGSERRAQAQYDATLGFDGTSLAPQIACPTLVLTGSEDEIIPAENSSEICKLIPQARLKTFPAMGHLLLIEDPENFVAQVRSFLESATR